MSRLVSVCLRLVLIFGMFSCLGDAQVSTGIPTFSSLDTGSFDAVNLGNLNVHFAISILNKPGRMTPFTYSLAYDSWLWQPVTTNGTTTWQPVSTINNVVAYWGWQGLGPIYAPYMSYSYIYQQGQCGYQGQSTYQVWTYNNFAYHDNANTGHYISGSSQYYNSPGGTGCPPNGPQPTSMSQATALDGSGTWRFKMGRTGTRP